MPPAGSDGLGSQGLGQAASCPGLQVEGTAHAKSQRPESVTCAGNALWSSLDNSSEEHPEVSLKLPHGAIAGRAQPLTQGQLEALNV